MLLWGKKEDRGMNKSINSEFQKENLSDLRGEACPGLGAEWDL